MEKDIAVKISNISKVYKLYDKPVDRLKESIHPLKKKYHKKFHALKNINLEIKKGEVLGIVGINGAGKSTLLKILAGVLTPTKGRVHVRGKLNAILELGSSLKKEMTGRENIKLNLRINGVEEGVNALIEDIIEFADIGEHIDQPVKTYSSGMKSRLGFGIATSTAPDVLIVDEVLAVGDVLFRRKCYSKIEQLFKSGKTIIFVSHSAQSVIEFCTRAILLYDRKIILDSHPKEVTGFYQRLVFSSDHSIVLNEIINKKLKSNSGEDGWENSAPSSELNEKNNVVDVKSVKSTSVKTDVAHYVSDLKSISRQEYDGSFLSIYDTWIETLDGEKVNALLMNETYNYCYKLQFKKQFKKVCCGMQIMTEKGLLISGSAYEISDTLVNNGEVLEVRWKFNCSMHAGIYYTNTGVIDENKKYINRVVDAYVFKVLPKSNFTNGLVSLQQRAPVVVQVKT